MARNQTKLKGDIGVAKTIVDCTLKGYEIYIPVSEGCRYDLIINDFKSLKRVQVKYSQSGFVQAATVWSDKNGIHKKFYQDDDFDYYALYIPNIEKVLYPSIKFKGCSIRTAIPKSPTPFYWYEDFLDFTDVANKKVCADFGLDVDYMSRVYSKRNSGVTHPNGRKVERPSKEELEKLLWEKPTIQLAKDFGASDRAIGKWAKFYGINKPPRGFWRIEECKSKLDKKV